MAKVKRLRGLEGGCSKNVVEQAKPSYVEKVMSSLSIGIDSKEPAANMDITTGFEIYHAILYCPSPVTTKLYRFLNEVLSSQSLRTLIQSLVNIFHTGVLEKNTTTFTMAKQLYLTMANILDLQYGNVLMATGTRSQLQAAIDNDWPFFANYTVPVKTCLTDSKCDQLKDVLKKLGKL